MVKIINQHFLIVSTGERFSAKSYNELVELMYRTVRLPPADSKAYMLQYSISAAQLLNLDIRATDADSFIEDLIKYDLIRRLPSRDAPTESL
jgi:hypothetical protein